MKPKNIFWIMYCIWLIDFSLTFVAINYFDGFYEANKIMAIFFNLGWYGWILGPMFAALGLYGLACIISKAARFVTSKTTDTHGIVFLTSAIVFYGFLEGMVIINNIKLLWGIIF